MGNDCLHFQEQTFNVNKLYAKICTIILFKFIQKYFRNNGNLMKIRNPLD